MCCLKQSTTSCSPRYCSNRRRHWQNYPYDIRPSTDDHPFFYHFFRWRQTPEIMAGLGRSWQPFGGSGFFVLVALLLLVSIAAAVFIVGPLLIAAAPWRSKRNRYPHWRQRVLIYFAVSRTGIFIRGDALAQQFILILGKPVIALAVVIFAVLLFSGLGSLASRRIPLSIGLGILVGLAAAISIHFATGCLHLFYHGRIGSELS